jgi:epsilon-lactone hydrolase
MASWQAVLINAVLRFGMKRHGNGPMDLERVRRTTLNPPKRALQIPAGWRIDEVRADALNGLGAKSGSLAFDVATREIASAAQPTDVVLYLHGGGYFFGSPKTHRQIIIAMARAFEGPCYGLDYRLAPEHRFPAAVEDAAAALNWIRAKHPTARIILAGDSAGGGLAVVTAVAAQARKGAQGQAMPAALVLFSPWTDLAATGRSIESNAKKCAMFTPRSIRGGASVYLGDADPYDPKASPLYADLTGLPPTLIFASRDEILLDDSTRFAEKAHAVGVDVELILADGVPHVWPIFHRLLPEGRLALEQVTRFARKIQKQPAAIAA